MKNQNLEDMLKTIESYIQNPLQDILLGYAGPGYTSKDGPTAPEHSFICQEDYSRYLYGKVYDLGGSYTQFRIETIEGQVLATEKFIPRKSSNFQVKNLRIGDPVYLWSLKKSVFCGPREWEVVVGYQLPNNI